MMREHIGHVIVVLMLAVSCFACAARSQIGYLSCPLSGGTVFINRTRGGDWVGRDMLLWNRAHLFPDEGLALLNLAPNATAEAWFIPQVPPGVSVAISPPPRLLKVIDRKASTLPPGLSTDRMELFVPIHCHLVKG